MKHTEGNWNWKQTRGNNRFEHQVYSDNIIIADLNGENSDEIKTNAKLIAAAPELLAVCLSILEDDKENAILLGIDRVNLKSAIHKAIE